MIRTAPSTEQLALDATMLAKSGAPQRGVGPFKSQLLKWVGNKQRFAHEIIGFFPSRFSAYREPFLGSGAVLGTLAPPRAVCSDVLKPLVGIWSTLHDNPKLLKKWYADRWSLMESLGKVAAFEKVKADYNRSPNAADLLFISRACYGGVVRFRQRDSGISTPCGIHTPIEPASFASRVDMWHERTSGAEFLHCDFEQVLDEAKAGDVVYCDPPYSHSQSILYGAQTFSLQRLLTAIERCKERGAFVVLSIDGSKKSGDILCDIPLPRGLFEREVFVNVGGSMLRRFQMKGESQEAEQVRDRLLLTY